MTSAAAASRARPPFAVIFDLDGTLVHSLPGIHRATAALLAEHGAADPGERAVRAWVGEGADRLVARAFAHAQLPAPPDATVLWRGHYRRLGPLHTVPREGAEDLLQVLHIAGMQLVMCTNKPQLATEELVDSLGWTSRFRALVGARPSLAPKPDPAPVLAALAAADCDPADVAFVGDSPADAAAALAAGVPLVLIRGGYSREPVDGLGADAVIDGLPTLPSALAQLFPGA